LVKLIVKGALNGLSCSDFNEIEPSISTIVIDELIPPVNSENTIVKTLTSPKLLRYRQEISNKFKNQIVKVIKLN
jgi:hypothetical protein